MTGSMWSQVIDLPDVPLKLWELVDILKASLDEDELKELCEEILGWPSKGFEVLDEFDLMD